MTLPAMSHQDWAIAGLSKHNSAKCAFFSNGWWGTSCRTNSAALLSCNTCALVIAFARVAMKLILSSCSSLVVVKLGSSWGSWMAHWAFCMQNNTFALAYNNPFDKHNQEILTQKRLKVIQSRQRTPFEKTEFCRGYILHLVYGITFQKPWQLKNDSSKHNTDFTSGYWERKSNSERDKLSRQ